MFRFSILDLLCFVALGSMFLAAIQKHGEPGAAGAILAGFFTILGIGIFKFGGIEVGAQSMLLKTLGILLLAIGVFSYMVCFWWPFAG